jgi:hypothetical protein
LLGLIHHFGLCRFDPPPLTAGFVVEDEDEEEEDEEEMAGKEYNEDSEANTAGDEAKKATQVTPTAAKPTPPYKIRGMSLMVNKAYSDIVFFYFGFPIVLGKEIP